MKGDGGDDALDNLITMCFRCHRKFHDGITRNGIYIPYRQLMIDLLESLINRTYFIWGRVLKILEEKSEY